MLSKTAGHEETIRLFKGSSLNLTSLKTSLSCPETSSRASSSSRTVAVKPGRQITRLWEKNSSAGMCLAIMKFWMVVSADASQTGRESSGESKESPIGQMDPRPFSGSRMIPEKKLGEFQCGKQKTRLTGDESGCGSGGNTWADDDGGETHDATVNPTATGVLVHHQLRSELAKAV